jgi:hypothetical protein
MQQLHCNRGKVFSVRFVPRYYKQDSESLSQWSWLVSQSVSELVKGLLQFSCCGLLLLEAGNRERRQFGNPKKGERQQLEAATKKRLMKT